MSLKKTQQVRADRGFKIFDLIIYCLVIVIAATLFLVVFFTKDTSKLKGIKIYHLNEVVFDYNFESKEYKKTDKTQVIFEDSEIIRIKITVKNAYNEVEIKRSGEVKMLEANCRTKDCIYTPKITNNSGSIFCQSHTLKILPYSYSIDNGKFEM